MPARAALPPQPPSCCVRAFVGSARGPCIFPARRCAACQCHSAETRFRVWRCVAAHAQPGKRRSQPSAASCALCAAAHMGETSPSALQVASLAKLQRLQLGGGGPGDYCDSLSRLTALTALTLLTGADVPDIVPLLAHLRSLHLVATPFGDDYPRSWVPQELDPALAQLTGLTRLWVIDPPPAAAFPTSLAGLSQLRRFCWLSDADPDDPRLPPGPWLASLQQLLVHVNVTARSAAVWPQAVQLACLRLQHPAPSSSSQQRVHEARGFTAPLCCRPAAAEAPAED